MSIAPIGGAGNGSGTSGVTSISVTYSPTAGNAVVLFMSFAATPSLVSVQDNLGNSLTAGPNRSNFQFAYFQFPVPSGVTGYTVTWLTSTAVGIVVEEYSGVAGVGSGVATTASGTSATVTSNLYAGDYVVMGFLTNPATATSGTIRQTHVYFSTGQIGLADNTSASPGNVSVTLTFASATYVWCSLILSAQGNPNGAGVNSGSAVATTLTTQFAATPGAGVCVFLTAAAAISVVTVKDNLGNSLTAGPVSSTNSHFAFYQYPVPSGVTSYIATWVTSRQAAMALQQYRSLTGITSGTAFDSTPTAATSASTTSTVDGGGLLVVGFVSPYPATPTSGTLEVGEPYFAGNPAAEIAIIDNNALTAGSVTCSVTFSSDAYAWTSLIIVPYNNFPLGPTKPITAWHQKPKSTKQRSQLQNAALLGASPQLGQFVHILTAVRAEVPVQPKRPHLGRVPAVRRGRPRGWVIT